MDTILRLLTPKKATYFILDTSTIRQALEKFDAHKFSVVPLLNSEGQYVGTLSEGDILRFIKNHAKFDITKAENVIVKDIDHYRPYRCLKIDATIEEIYALALDQSFVPLIDDQDHYIGIIKRKDVLIHLNEKK
jgi:CBS domain-containing protein